MLNFYLKVYGCQLNLYDAQKIIALLTLEGYSQTEKIELADIVIFYTCSIREKAVQKLYSDIGKVIKKSKPLIAVGGCVAQQMGEDLIKRVPEIDIVFGPQNIQEVPELLEQILHQKQRHVAALLPDISAKFKTLSSLPSPKATSSFLAIQEGCDNFCTYCIVPYTRGHEYSRSPHDIIDEAKRIVANGGKEIVLLGQNVNAYKASDNGKFWRLEDIIYSLSQIDGLARIRYMSPNPQNMTDELIAAHGEIDKLMPSVHLPLQSGSNRVLKKMNRPYTAESYLEIAAKLRSAKPDISISTDIIVGFPSETEEDFFETLKVCRTALFSNAFYFKYSRRPGTPADKMQDQIADDVKSTRFDVLDQELKARQGTYNKSFVGHIVEVLVEGTADGGEFLFGRTRHNVPCCLTGGDESLIGTLQLALVLTSNLKTIIADLRHGQAGT